MAITQGPAGSSENAIVQDSIHSLIDKEVREIIRAIRPDGDPSSLIVQPDVQKAIARLKSEVSQLIREAEIAPRQSITRFPTPQLDEEIGGDSYDAVRGEIPRDEQNIASSAGKGKTGQPTEPRDSQLGITIHDITLDTRPSLVIRKSMSAYASAEQAQADWDHQGAEEENRQRKEWYFFYGSLMDPRQLQRVLGLKEKPKDLQPAEIIGYHTRMWGPYPVLLDGPPGNVVKGIRYKVEGGENKDKLAAYETANYREHKCLIRFREESTIGTTFKWAGDVSELKGGGFDLKDWQMARLLED